MTTDAALEKLVAAADAAHPHLLVDISGFLRHVARHLPPPPVDPAEALARLHGGDLYLAFACAQQVSGALAIFEEVCGAAIQAALRGGFTAAFVDDVEQLLREKLFVGDQVEEPRILSYAGRGPLAAWVAVSARRTALSMSRSEASTRARHEAAGREELAGQMHPELAYLKRTYRAAFADAFTTAFADISVRDRALLRLTVLERLRLEQIAPMFQVNVSTISRWLAAARERILERTREDLAKRLQISATEFGSIARLVQSQIDVSLARLLADKPTKEPHQ